MGDEFKISARLDASQMLTQLKQINTQLLKTNNLLMATHSQSRKANTALNRTGKGAKKTGGAYKGLGKSLGGAMAGFIGLNAIMGIGIGKLQEAFQWAMQTKKAYREWDEAIANVSTIISDFSNSILPQLAGGIENLSKKWGQSTKDLAKGMYDILSAAFEATDALNLLSTATKASIAGLTTVSKSVDVFTSILNAYGQSVHQATQLSDMLFQTVVRGKLTYEDLASSMGYIAPIAANLGVEFKEIAAALSTVTRQGQHVDMATRGLALGIQNIADITPKAAKAAEKYGVDMSATTLRVGGLQVVLEDLNRAMKEHGAKVLPEMITNMRSLRVFMALTGKEGIEGYRKDMDLLNDSAGRTEEALAKVAGTTQMAAKIMEQSMQQLERSIGEAWHNIDIYWKKAKLWWGTYLSGGDADKAVKTYEKRIKDLKRAQETALIVSMRLQKMQPLDEAVLKHLKYARSSAEDLSKEFENLSDAGVDVVEIFKSGEENIKAWSNGINIAGDASSELLADWNRLIKTRQEWNTALTTGTSETIISNVDWKSIDEYMIQMKEVERLAEQINEAVIKRRAQATPETMAAWMEEHPGENILEYAHNFEELQVTLDGVRAEAGENEAAFNKFTGAMDNLEQLAEDTKLNMIDLSNSLEILDFELDKVYNTLSKVEEMNTFEGKLHWELQVKGLDIAISRFKHFSDIAINYGTTMREDFMDEINKFDSELSGVDLNIEWFDKTIWDMVEGSDKVQGKMGGLISSLHALKTELKDLGEQGDVLSDFQNLGDLAAKYGGEFTKSFEEVYESVKDFNIVIDMSSGFQTEFNSDLVNVINTMHEYEEAEKKAKEEKEKMNAVMDAQNKILMKNNLELSKIQLQGMMRRRGNTRSEELMMKHIQIENLKIRIAMTEDAIANEEAGTGEINDVLEDRYEEASDIYSEYMDRMNYEQDEMVKEAEKAYKELERIYNDYLTFYDAYLWEIKDGRDSDLQEFMISIDRKREQQEKYLLYLKREEDTLGDIYQAFIDIATAIDTGPNAEAWEEFFGMSQIELYASVVAGIKQDLIDIGVMTGAESSYNPNVATQPTPSGPAQGGAVIPSQPPSEVRDTTGGTDTGSRALSRGIKYVHETGPAIIHKGEQVIPSGSKQSVSGGDTVNVSISVNAKVENDYDVERLAGQLGTAMQSKLVNKRGKSKYRMR